MTRSLLLAALLVASQATAAAPDASITTTAERKIDGLAVPLLGFNSDEGFGIGAAGGAYLYERGFEPYRLGFAGQFYLTTHGIQSHFLRIDAPRALPGPGRLEARIEYRRERFAPYYGAGNESATGAVIRARDRFYSYDRLTAGAWARVRLGDPTWLIQPYAGYGYRQVTARAQAGTLLESDAPRGLEGGAIGQFLVGGVHDTRDQEADPSRGGVEEISLKVAGRATASRYDFGQATLSLRRFVPVGSRVVLAGRLLGDWLFGDVPFFELPFIGGLAPAEGIGGTSTVRGIERHRYTGTLKLVANAEVRAVFFEPRVLGERMKLGAVLFGDAGRAWAPRVADGPWYRFHPAGGLGLRAVRKAAVARLDLGVSADRTALYLQFGHLF